MHASHKAQKAVSPNKQISAVHLPRLVRALASEYDDDRENLGLLHKLTGKSEFLMCSPSAFHLIS